MFFIVVVLVYVLSSSLYACGYRHLGTISDYVVSVQ